MGHVSSYSLTIHARYLIEMLVLREEENYSVHYSYFFDGTDETTRRLALEVFGDAEHYEAESCCCRINDAAAMLEELGLVEIEWLENEQLADGEPAYRIHLTRAGIECILNDDYPTLPDIVH